MNRVQHTPGPWKVCGGVTPHFKAVHSNGGYIVFSMADPAYCMETGRPIATPNLEEQAANARLIAAAPDILDALKECESIMRGARAILLKLNPYVRLEVHDAIAAQAVAAIAKAEGSTSP